MTAKDWREKQIRLIKGAGQTIIDNADNILPDNLNYVTSIEIRCSIEPECVPEVSWTVNRLNQEFIEYVDCGWK